MLITSWQFTVHTAACSTEFYKVTTVWNMCKYWMYFQQHSKLLHLWTITWLKGILQWIHSWQWAFYENSVANVAVRVFWDETTCSWVQGSSVLRKVEISRGWTTLVPTCQTACHHTLQVHKPQQFDITDTGMHTGVWRMKPRNIKCV